MTPEDYLICFHAWCTLGLIVLIFATVDALLDYTEADRSTLYGWKIFLGVVALVLVWPFVVPVWVFRLWRRGLGWNVRKTLSKADRKILGK